MTLMQTTVLIAHFAAPFDHGASPVWLFDTYAQCSASIGQFEAIKGAKVNALTCKELVALSPLAPRATTAPPQRPER
jgi:hypothetical protein